MHAPDASQFVQHGLQVSLKSGSAIKNLIEEQRRMVSLQCMPQQLGSADLGRPKYIE
jgi:hypothetical protein